jgi:hypothetical protein
MFIVFKALSVFPNSVTGPNLHCTLICLRIYTLGVLSMFCYSGENLTMLLVGSSALERRTEGRDPCGLRHSIAPMTSVLRPRKKTKGVALRG